MYRRKIDLTVVFLLGSLCAVAAHTDLNDSTLLKSKSLETENSSTSDVQFFEQLHIPINENNADPIIIPQQIFTDSTEQYRTKAFEYQNEVLRRNAFIGNLNQL